MSAERLREAAKVLRERANDAACAAGTAWRYSDIAGYQVVMAESDPPGAEVFSCDACRYDGRGDGMATTSEECAHYIATMDPSVGLALADWLDTEAAEAEYYGAEYGAEWGTTAEPLAVADAILGASESGGTGPGSA